MTVRQPVVAGQFYPGHPIYLREAIEKSFTGVNGVGGLPGKRDCDHKINGVIVPHAGYMYSGAAASWAYKKIAESKMPDTYIILGVNHSGRNTCVSDQDWKTLTGTVKADEELVKMLDANGIPINNEEHGFEHSIEVQLPLLEFCSRDKIKNLRIVCIMIADDEIEKWSKIIHKSVSDLKREVVYICSSDFTHYGPNYSYTPFKNPKSAKEDLYKLDEGAIKKICDMDIDGFLKYCKTTGATICGKYGIAVLIEIMKLVHVSRGELLKYYTSGDIIEDYENAVGYASIVFE